MRKGILLVVVLFAVAGLMGTFAYTSASVTSDASFTVVNTDEALLALVPSEDHNGAFIDNKRLVIDWDKGFDNGDFGLQQYSTYVWDDLFAVKNNSENQINVKVFLDPDLAPKSIYFEAARVADRWVNVANEPLEFSLDPNEETWIDTKLHSGSGMNMHLGEYKFALIVEADVETTTMP